MTVEKSRAVQRNMEDKKMEVLYGICSGVDVHKKLLVVCLRSGRKTEIRSFGTTTQELFDIKDSFFSAQFARISAHRGAKRAYVAVAHSMLIAIYHILSDGEIFKDLGSNYYNNFNKERKANSMVKKLKALGYDVTIAAATATA